MSIYRPDYPDPPQIDDHMRARARYHALALAQAVLALGDPRVPSLARQIEHLALSYGRPRDNDE
jgi:hypothetical protein